MNGPRHETEIRRLYIRRPPPGQLDSDAENQKRVQEMNGDIRQVKGGLAEPKQGMRQGIAETRERPPRLQHCARRLANRIGAADGGIVNDAGEVVINEWIIRGLPVCDADQDY